VSRSDLHRLEDMLMAADEIAQIVHRGRAEFDSDPVFRRALERCLEILGEASKGVSADLRTAHPELPWRDLAKVRDRLSHHYHRIDPAQLWVIAAHDVPMAAQQLSAIAVGLRNGSS
jgi:uncharacterized protein with HEPN domain